jgi:putative toxin-antitoxin system antitoxin component (TIGR02293 family)
MGRIPSKRATTGRRSGTIIAKQAAMTAGAIQVIGRATEVIGDRGEALRWLGTPVHALAYATPVSLLGTSQGRDRVLTVLDRLEHGVL